MRCTSRVASAVTAGPSAGSGGSGLVQDRVHRVDAGVAAERRPAGEHLVQQDAEAEDVAAVIDLAAARLLGRHVGDGAEHHARDRFRP